jgi:hypothetical protein
VGTAKQVSKIFLSEFSSAVWLVRAPLFVALTAAFALSVDQIQEILYLYTEESFQQSGVHLVLACTLFVLFCWLLWRLSLDLLAVGHFQEDFVSRRAHILRRMLPVIIAVIPFFSLYLGLNNAYRELAIIPAASGAAPGGTVKPAEPTAAQVAQASRRAFTPREVRLRPQHAIIWQELSRRLQDLSEPGPRLHRALQAVLGLGAALLLAGCIYALFSPPRSLGGEEEDGVLPRTLRWKWLWILSFVLFLTLFALQGLGYTGLTGMLAAVPSFVGTSSIVLLFLIFLTIFLGLLTRLYDKLEIPAISILVLAALVGSYEDWNNNHAVRLLKRDAVNPPPLSAAFAAWAKNLGSNPDGYFQKYLQQGKSDYPVFLFAMQGGGQYSSAFASLTLAKLFDRCPALRHHVFALSGVSGGSVGAGFFVAQLRSELSDRASPLNSDLCDFDLAGAGASKPQTGPLEAKIGQLQQSDFLAPLAADGLFGDFLQRFIPWPPLPGLDRARAFETGLEFAWRTNNPGKPSPLEDDFLNQWSPSGNVPMLLLNTTRVQTGEPVLAAPFLSRRPITNAAELRTIYSDAAKAGESVRLSTAMSLSARFPIVMPVGRFHPQRSAAYFDLVDGGYFENSGAETIRVMHEELSFYRNYPLLLDPTGALKPVLEKLRFKAIVLNEFDAPDTLKAQTLNEVASPLEALYRARTQRGAMAINRLFTELDIGVIRISHDPFPLPLGWRLSLSKQQFLSSMVGTPNECDDSTPFEIVRAARLVASQYQAELKKVSDLDEKTRVDTGKRIGSLYYLMHRNRCVLRDIVRDVRPAG